MWDILRLPSWRISVYLCLWDKDKMIWRINSIIIPWRLTCFFWIYRLRAYGSKIDWYLGFEIGCSVGILMGELVGYILSVSLCIFIGLMHSTFFGLWIGFLSGLNVVTWEVLVFDSKIVIPRISPLGMSLVNPLVSLLDSICNISCFCPWLVTWQLIWHFSWVLTLFSSLHLTCHDD